MNTHKTPTTNVEEEWIVKYRAALDAAPIEQSLATRLRAVLIHACSIVLSYTVKVVDKRIHWQSSMMNPALQPELTTTQRFRIPLRRGNREMTKDAGAFKKVS
jgi:hypothetical protein